VASRGTRATELLAAQGISYRLHDYDDSAAPAGTSYGLAASIALAVDPVRVFKTLIASVDGVLTAAVVPVTGQLDLKALARAAGGKKAVMAGRAQAERATGYVTGGISPIGPRKPLPVVVDATALQFGSIYCSAGRRGLQLELSPGDLIHATGATIAEISRASG
jgi:Cys-tRNA(Pro)/Cys-tRNA(Cys) deacylase